MSSAQIARDEDEIRCVSPQRLVSASSTSRVLSFAPRNPEPSRAEKWRELQETDPRAAQMLLDAFERIHARVCR
jgi:hypothetical protein